MNERIIINGREYRGHWSEATEIVRPDGQPMTVEAKFVVTHLEHFCIVCGKTGWVHYLGTFKSPVDGLEYPYCVCTIHEPAGDGSLPDESGS